MMVCVRFELEALVVALAEGAVALAGEQVADLAEPHVAVHLGVLAARDVEAIARLALLQHLASRAPRRGVHSSCRSAKVCIDVLPPTAAAICRACSMADWRTDSAIVFLATSTPWLAFSVS